MAEKRQMTLTDKRALEQELAELNEAKKRVAEDIKTARGFGDLSENAEYDAAKKEEAHVYGRAQEVEAILANAIFIDDTQVSGDVVAVGTVVTCEDLEFGDTDDYTIVGFTETDADQLFISQDSPIGAALIGAKVGDIVDVKTPGGMVKLKVNAIRRR